MSRLLAMAAIATLLACSSKNPSGNTSPTDESGIQKPCETDSDCGSGGACCDSTCQVLDLSNDACGSCGVQCTPSQFCTGTACASLNFQALCANTDVSVIHREGKSIQGVADNPQADNDAADSLATAFHTLCGASSPTAFVTAETDVLATPSAGPLTTGRNSVLVVAGGRVYSTIIDYLDTAEATPVELVNTPNYFQLVARSERKVIVQDTLANVDANHDYVVGQAIYDATSGTQILDVYGILQTGTTAGVGYFSSLVSQTGFGSTYWFVGRLENGVVTRLDGQ